MIDRRLGYRYATAVYVSLLLGVCSHPATAQVSDWFGPSPGAWNDASHWQPNVVPNGPNAVARFAPAGIPGFGIISVDTDVEVAQLMTDGAASLLIQGAGALTFSGEQPESVALNDPSGLLILDVPLVASDPWVARVAESASLQIGAALDARFGAASKRGEGQLLLLGENDLWAGPLTVEAGSVVVGDENSLGSDRQEASGTYLATNARLMIESSVQRINEFVTLDGGTIASQAPSINWRGRVNVPAESWVNTSEAGRITFQDGIQGAGTLHLDANQITLNRSPDFSGQLIVARGTLVVDASNSLGSSSGTETDGTVLRPGTTLRINGSDIGSEWLSMDGATITFTSNAAEEFSANVNLNGMTTFNSTRNGEIQTLGEWSGSGGVVFEDFQRDVTLNHNSTYDGPTTFRGLTAHVHNAATAFGSSAGETFVEQGSIVQLLSQTLPVQESFHIAETSAIHLFDIHTLTGDLFLSGGLVLAGSGNEPLLTFDGDIHVNSQGEITTDDRTLTINGDIHGRGRLELNAETLRINGNISDDLSLVVQQITFEEATTLSELAVKHGLHADAPVTIGRLTLPYSSGQLTTGPNGVLILREDDGLRFATVDANLQIDGPLVVNDRHGPQLISVGSNFENEIRVDGGSIYVTGNEGLGSAVVGTEIVAGTDGRIVVAPNLTLDEPIRLNGGHGLRNQGSLLTFTGRNENGGDTILRGPLDLGGDGASLGHVGPAPVRLIVQGPVVGGDLRVLPRADVVVAGAELQYTGETIVSGKLSLRDAARLTTTEDIILNQRFAILDIADTPDFIDDRIADHIPIRLRGGSIQAQNDEGQILNETLGDIYVEQSESTIIPGTTDGRTRLTLSSIVRNAGATLNVSSGPRNLLRLRLTDPLPTTNGILPAWLRTGGHFARLNGSEIVQREWDRILVQNGNANNHIQLDRSQSITSDATIGSLGSFGRDTLDLGGNLLTLETGGLIASDIMTLTNGRLTSGADELYLYGDSQIQANIVDGVSPVSLVISTGEVHLSGSNQYSGSTTINGNSSVYLSSSNALPNGTDVILNGGELNDAGGLTLGRLELRDGSIAANSGAFRPTEIIAESGAIWSGLAGDAPLTKVGPDTLVMGNSMLRYTGDIFVQEGALIANNDDASGRGAIRVLADGSFSAAGTVRSDVTLNGGSLWSQGNARYAKIHVESDSQVHAAPYATEQRNAGSNLTFAGPITGSGDLVISSYSSDISFVVANPDFQGNFIVEGRPSVILAHANAVGPMSSMTIRHDAALYADARQPIQGRFALNGGEIRSRVELSEFADSVQLQGETYAYGNQRFSGSLELLENASLIIEAAGRVDVPGTLRFSPNSTLRVQYPDWLGEPEATLNLSGRIVATAPDSQLHLEGRLDESSLAASELHLPHDTSGQIQIKGELVELNIGADVQRLSGAGTLKQNARLMQDGVIGPGDETEDIDTLTIEGDLNIDNGGELIWNIAGHDLDGNALADRLQVAGTVISSPTAGFAPTTIRLVPSQSSSTFSPLNDYRWTLIEASDLQISTSAFELDPSVLLAEYEQARLGAFELVVEANTMRLQYAAPDSLGDTNGDGVVDVQDVDLIQRHIKANTFAVESDLNRDQVVDQEDLRIWVEQINNTYFGDSNLDGQFESTDLIQVFSFGEYEDDKTNNSTWASGDWNADGEFDSGDLVVAFRGGGYDQGPREAGVATRTSAVPEPMGRYLWLGFLLPIVIGRRSAAFESRRKVVTRHARNAPCRSRRPSIARFTALKWVGFLLAIVMFFPDDVWAQGASTWNAVNGGNWSDAGHWFNGVPNRVQQSAVFGTVQINRNASINVDQAVTIGVLVDVNVQPLQLEGVGPIAFDNGDNSASIVLGLAAGHLDLSVPIVLPATQSLSVVSNIDQTITLGGPILAGDSSLVHDSPGSLVLAGDNQAWQGQLIVSGGTVYASHASSLGGGGLSESTQTRVTEAGHLRIDAEIASELIIMEGGRLGTDSQATIGGEVRLAADSFLSSRSSSRSLTVNANVTGEHGFTMDGGRVVLTAENSFQGAASVVGGELVVMHPLALGNADAITVVQESGALRIETPLASNVVVSVGGEVDLLETPIGSINVVGGEATYRAATAAPIVTLRHHIPNAGPVERSALVLPADSPHTFASIVSPESSGGDLLLGDGITSTLGGTLRFDFADLPTADFRLGASRSASFDAGAVIVSSLPDRMLKFGGGEGRLAVPNILTDSPLGPTSVEQDGRGETILAGVNTYTGATFVRSGRLVATHPFALGQGSGKIDDATTVFEDGILEIDNIGNWSGELIRLDGGQLDFTNRRPIREIENTIEVMSGGSIAGGGDVRLHGRLAGNGTLQIEHNFLTLNSSHDFAGPIEINRGRTVVKNSGGLGSTSQPTRLVQGILELDGPVKEPIEVEGGTLRILEGSNNYLAPLTLAGGKVELVAPTVDLNSNLLLKPNSRPLIEANQVTFHGGTSGIGNLVIEANEMTVTDRGWNHQGNLSLASGIVTMQAHSSYTGTTYVDDAVLIVNHPNALGTLDAPTRVGGDATIRFVTSSHEPVIVEYGGDVEVAEEAQRVSVHLELNSSTLNPFDQTVEGTIKLNSLSETLHNLFRGGEVAADISGPGSVAVSNSDQLLILSGDNSYEGMTLIGPGTTRVTSPTGLGSTTSGTIIERGTLELNATTSEPIFLGDSGKLVLNERQVVTPVFLDGKVPRRARGVVEINHPAPLTGPVRLLNHDLVVNADATIDQVELLAPYSHVLVNHGNTLTLNQSTLELNTGNWSGDLAGPQTIEKLGPGFATLEAIERFGGQIMLREGELQVGGPGSLGTPAGATFVESQSSLVFTQGGVFDEPIQLIDANGGGAFIGGLVATGRQDVTLQGPIELLGEHGSTVSGLDTRLILAGPIRGSNLSVDGIEYSDGVVITHRNDDLHGETVVRYGTLTLRDSGAITELDSIRLSGGTLEINNSQTTDANRLSDDAPLVFEGGILLFMTPSQSFTEVVGELVLQPGLAQINARRFFAHQGTLESTGITRHFGSSLELDDSALKIQFTQPPPLENGIVGGWAATEDRFLTYDENGLVPYAGDTNDPLSAAPTDNLVNTQSDISLASDTTLNSVVATQAFDLGGHQLTVASGGLIGGYVHNGTLTAGLANQDQAELFLRGYTIQASIVDNGDTPVTVVVTGRRGTTLEGANQHTGGTFVTGTRATIAHPDALPRGSDLTVLGGRLELNTQTVELGEVFIDRHSTVIGSRGSTFEFERLELGAADIDAEIVGDGTLHKFGNGHAQLHQLSLDFTGRIAVDEGTLTVSDSRSRAPIRVNGGRLKTIGNDFGHHVTMSGGTLDPTGAHLAGGVVVEGRATLLSGGGRVSGLSGQGHVTIESTQATPNSISYDRPLNLDGDVDFDGQIEVVHGGLNLATTVVGAAPSIYVRRSGWAAINADEIRESITIDSGRLKLEAMQTNIVGDLTFLGQSRLETYSQQIARISGTLDLTLSEQLQLYGEFPLQIDGTILVDNTTVWNAAGDVNIAGLIVPASNDSHLTIDGPSQQQVNLNAAIQLPQERRLRVLSADGSKQVITQDGAAKSIYGKGSLVADVTLRNDASLQPGGNAIGQLTIEGAVTLGDGGVWDVQIAGTSGQAGIDWDSLQMHSLDVEQNENVIKPALRLGLPQGVQQISNFNIEAEYSWPLATGVSVDLATLSVIEIDDTNLRSAHNIPTNEQFTLTLEDDTILLVYGRAALRGDINGNQLLDVDDLNQVALAAQSGNQDSLYDLNEDGIVDVNDHTFWVVELKQTYIGDANLDGLFETDDLIEVFRFGEYEDALIQNSTWQSGDWNGDGEFDTADLIAAFRDGGFGQGPRATTAIEQAAVPEPIQPGWLSTLLVFCFARRRMNRS